MTDGNDRVVLVTGAARRLGRAIARDFGMRGWRVAAHVHGVTDEASTLIDEITAAGGTAKLFAANLSDMAAVDALVPAVNRALGVPTCVVNNASVFEYDNIADVSVDTWDRHFAVNLRAPVFLAKAMAAHLPDGVDGAVINIIDQRVWKPTPHFLSYSGSKAALWAMTQTLAQGLAPRVRVNAIGPGPMLRSVHQSEADFAAQAAATLLQRATNPEEITAAIRFILDAPAMTGQMIALDGGQHLAWQTPDIGDGRG